MTTTSPASQAQALAAIEEWLNKNFEFPKGIDTEPTMVRFALSLLKNIEAHEEVYEPFLKGEVPIVSVFCFANFQATTYTRVLLDHALNIKVDANVFQSLAASTTEALAAALLGVYRGKKGVPAEAINALINTTPADLERLSEGIYE